MSPVKVSVHKVGELQGYSSPPGAAGLAAAWPAHLLWCSVQTGLLPRPHHGTVITAHYRKEYIMGKYFLAWIMGVPAIVLVLFYLFFH
jgi:hypothetical protein